MQLGVMLYQSKAGPEFVMKSVWAIANNVQPTASGRAFGAKRGNDNVAARLDGMRYLAHVGHPVL